MVSSVEQVVSISRIICILPKGFRLLSAAALAEDFGNVQILFHWKTHHLEILFQQLKKMLNSSLQMSSKVFM